MVEAHVCEAKECGACGCMAHMGFGGVYGQASEAGDEQSGYKDVDAGAGWSSEHMDGIFVCMWSPAELFS